jgi:hypothetical protein
MECGNLLPLLVAATCRGLIEAESPGCGGKSPLTKALTSQRTPKSLQGLPAFTFYTWKYSGTKGSGLGL